VCCVRRMQPQELRAELVGAGEDAEELEGLTKKELSRRVKVGPCE
jgi:hypothetical protein